MARPTTARARLRRLAVALVVFGGIAVAAPGLAAPGDGAGSILTFGDNEYGQLGRTANGGTITVNPAPAEMTLLGAVGRVTNLAAGNYHTLATTSSGQLFAAGYNYYGQLGNPTNLTTETPHPSALLVTLPGQTGPVTQIAAGGVYSLAATSTGQLFGFGSNQFAQLGNSTNTGINGVIATPALATLPGQIGTIAVLSAGSHSLAATSSGQLYAFGNNRWGELGNATNNGIDAANPPATPVTLPGQAGTVTGLAAGTNHSLVLTSSGQLYSFGRNQYGELGRAANAIANPAPALVALPGQSGAIIQIAAGAQHSVALTASGQIYTFGRNIYGQLGTPTASGTNAPSPTPSLVALPGATGLVAQVSAGAGHTLAVTSSGQLFVFGRNYYGQLGNAINTGVDTPNPPALVAFPAPTTIARVAVGAHAFHSVALVSNLAVATTALASAQVGSPYSATLQGAGGTSPLTWTATGLPAGLAFDPAGPTISGTPTAPGVSQIAVTVTDAYGTTVSNTLALTVAAAAPPIQPPAPKAALSAVKQSAGRWLLGNKLARLVKVVPKPVKRKGVPVGTTFSFNVDRAAQVTLTFRHTAQGRRVSGKCVARTNGNAGRPRCARTLTDGALRVQAKAGTNRLRFEGRISASKKLKAGAYSVVLTAKAAATAASPPKSLRFTIARG